jgi:hypothetical protein
MISKYQLHLIALLLIMAGCIKPIKTTINAGSVKQLKYLLDKNEYFKLDDEFKATL